MANRTIGFTARILHERSGLHSYEEGGFTYDQPGAKYDNNPAYIRRFTARACLVKLTPSIQIGAYVVQPRGGQTFTTKARVSRLEHTTLDAQARIAHLHSESINFKARLSHLRTSDLQVQARLVREQMLQAQARILRHEQHTLSGQARMLKHFDQDLTLRASLVRWQPFQAQARIKRKYTYTLQVRARVSQKRSKTIRLRGKVRPYSRFTVRARLKEASWKRRYVNALSEPTVQRSVAGRGDVLIHTNGNSYCVFADSYSNAVAERRLYLVISTDGGLTWGDRIQLTSGGWDNMPSLLQLDTDSTTSGIGLAFVRGIDRNIYRLSFSTTGTITYGPGAIKISPSNTNNSAYPQLVKTGDGKFRVICLSSNAYKSMVVYESATFNNASSWATIASPYPGETTINALMMTSLTVRRHANSGHLFALVTYVSAKNGSDTAFYYHEANTALGLGACFSTDDGTTWTFIKPVATSTWNASVDLAAHACPLAADFVELNDGTIGILYQEGTVHQIISGATNPPVDCTSGEDVSGVVYDKWRDNLIVSIGYNSPYNDLTLKGGIQFYSRDIAGAFTQAFKLTVQSTPPIWCHQINSISLSPTGRYLAVATDYGITVVDMQNADHSQWVVQEFRRSNFAPMLANRVIDAQWVSDTVIVYGHGEQQVGAPYACGGKFDITDPVNSFVRLYVKNTGSSLIGITSRLKIVNNVAFFEDNNARLQAVDLTTCTGLANWAASSMNGDTPVYDAINDELVVVANNILYFLKFDWTAKTLTQLRSINTTTDNPRLYMAPRYLFNVGDNIGAASSNDYSIEFYNPDTKTFLGAIHSSEATPGLSVYPGTIGPCNPKVIDIKGTKWLLIGGDDDGIWFYPLDNTGKLRYGTFTYDQTANQLYEEDVPFYDMVNPRTVNGNDYNQVEFPRVGLRQDGALVIYGRFCDPMRRKQPFAPIITLGWTDGMTLTAKARILLPTSLLFRASVIDRKPTLSTRGFIIRHIVPTFTAKAWIRSNGPLSAKATVLKTQIRPLSVRGRILGHITRTMTVRGRLVRLTGISAKARLTPLRQLQIRTRICFPRVKTLAVKAHIHILGKPQMAVQARLRGIIARTLTGQARIIHGSAWEIKARLSQRQGWPIPASYDGQIAVFTDTSLRMRTRIGEAILNTTTFGLRARIYPVKFSSLGSRARLVSGKTMQMRASIAPWRMYVHLPCSYSVQSVVKKRLRMVFYMQGNYQEAQFGMRTRIANKYQKRFTGHFIVPMPQMVGTIMTLETSNQLNYNQVFGAKAFITRAY